MTEQPQTSPQPPIIDIGPLLDTATAPQRSPMEAEIHSACLATGFFVAVGHGIETEMGALFEQAEIFFGQPSATKEQIPRINRYGFVPHRDHAIDRDRRLGNTEFLDIGLHNEVPLPTNTGLAAAVRAYQQAGLEVAARILSVVATSLGADADFFTSRMTDPQCRLRLLHYLPAIPASDGSLPVPTESHTDYGAITLLATDGVPGLEVKPIDSPWVPVVAPPGSLVINLGDMLARWSNDVYRSTPHRVVGPLGTDRISIPFFINPDPSTIVECIPGCVSAEQPRRYKSVTAGDFLASRIDNSAVGGAEPYVNRSDGPVRTVSDMVDPGGPIGR